MNYLKKAEIISKWATSDVDIVFTHSEQNWLETEQEISYVFEKVPTVTISQVYNNKSLFVDQQYHLASFDKIERLH